MAAVVGVRHIGQFAERASSLFVLGSSSRLTMVIWEVTDASAQCIIQLSQRV